MNCLKAIPQLCLGLGLRAADLRCHLLTLGDRFVANSQAVAAWLGAPSAQVSIVHNSVDQDLFDVPFDPPARLRVALIGSLTQRKGVADFVALARLAEKAGLALDFVMIGSESADLAALGPLPDTVRHAGYIAQPATAMAPGGHCAEFEPCRREFRPHGVGGDGRWTPRYLL
nr:hypothetical protein [Sulfitobacter sp. S223]